MLPIDSVAVDLYIHTYIHTYVRTYIHIIPAAYLEYRIDNFGLKKHLPESVKKLYLE